MRTIGMVVIAGWLVASSAVQADSRQTSRGTSVTFRLATTVAAAGFDRLAYNGEVLFVASRPSFTSQQIRAADTSDGGSLLELTITREAASDLASQARRAQSDRLAVFVGSRIVAAATIDVNDADGLTVLSGFSAGLTDRLVALLSREGVAYAGPLVTVSGSHAAILAGQVFTVDTFVSGVPDLGAYQVALDVSGGSSGSILIEDVEIIATRPDYVFDATAIKVTDPQLFRAASVMMDGGVDAEELAYMATYTLRATADASGTFEVSIKTGERSLLRDSEAIPIPFRPGQGFSITVGNTVKRKAISRQ